MTIETKQVTEQEHRDTVLWWRAWRIREGRVTGLAWLSYEEGRLIDGRRSMFAVAGKVDK